MQTDSVEKAAGIGAIGLWAALHGWLGWLVVLYAVCTKQGRDCGIKVEAL